MQKYHPHKIEVRWQKEWQRARRYEPYFTKAKKPFYNLMMFPYPSAEGLHMGNMYAFTGSDIYGRFQRMQGYDVFEPIGLDGFGIHSENYALKIGMNPARQAAISEKRFYKQLELIGNSFAWNERLETYDPAYYRWTQWLFIQMFKAGLAYRKKAEVNWCTSCLTVLADEQVVGEKCERCGSAVIQKQLEQWFFKITDYAERLLKNIDTLDWSEKVKVAQKNWIGKSEGVVIKFKTADRAKTRTVIEVFTTRPDTIRGVSFIALAPTHPLVKFRNLKSEFRNLKAVHPITKKELPVYVADYVMSEYGTGAIMGVPAHDERDRAFAEKHAIPRIDAPLMAMDEAIKKTGGRKETRYHLRDWLVSRQRYWGPPIPLVFCEACKIRVEDSRFKIQDSLCVRTTELSIGELENPGWIAVPEKDLPVSLPIIKNFRPTGTGKSPLASVKSFYETPCPTCGGTARRETDVSDTFLDSSWYYIAYLAKTRNQKSEIKNPFTNPLIKKWLPVHRYIGGAEHSVLHLLYARFVAMALHDGGHIHCEEPFAKFRAHGLLIKEGAKMSKSKGNVVNPDEYIARLGADTLRVYLMFLAPFEAGGDFRDEAVLGVHRFLNRVWKLGINAKRKAQSVKDTERLALSDLRCARIMHQTIKKVTEDIEKLHYNTAISALMILLRALEEGGAGKNEIKIFLQLLAPFAPHITEELWHALGEKKSIHVSLWPQWDAAQIAEDTFHLIVQINGKTRAALSARKGIAQETAEQLARADETAQKWIKEKKITRIIFVPNRLINFIVE